MLHAATSPWLGSVGCLSWLFSSRLASIVLLFYTLKKKKMVFHQPRHALSLTALNPAETEWGFCLHLSLCFHTEEQSLSCPNPPAAALPGLSLGMVSHTITKPALGAFQLAEPGRSPVSVPSPGSQGQVPRLAPFLGMLDQR